MRLPEQARTLVCPGCGTRSEPAKRFCEACGLPLVLDGLAAAEEHPQEVSERRARVRKIKPQLAEGDLVRVAHARNQPEAEFIQSLLLEEGVPSMLRRSAGFDVPDMLAAGPRDIMVPRSGMSTAREVLLEAEVIPGAPAAGTAGAAGTVGTAGASRAAARPWRLLAGLLVALVIGSIVIVLLAALTH
jgi:hypothetical protein